MNKITLSIQTLTYMKKMKEGKKMKNNLEEKGVGVRKNLTLISILVRGRF